jgi:uncharacterized lipoprotein YmbA
MRSRTPALVVLGLAAAVVCGCVLKRSKESQLFVLEPLAARGASSAQSPPRAVVGLLPVEVPDWMDRPQITRRVAGSQVTVFEFARWGEPIGRGAQRVVAENLAALLPERRVIRAPWAGYEPVVHKVDLTLSELAGQPDGSVLLEARWAVIGKDRETLLQRRSTHRSPTAAADPKGTVDGTSQVLEAVSREIADALEALPVQPR